MTKSILVIDTPENCIGCDFSDCELKEWYCERAKRYLKESEGEESRPDWCPLLDLPDCKDFENERQKSILEDCYNESDPCDKSFLQGYVAAWNACIEKILKVGVEK